MIVPFEIEHFEILQLNIEANEVFDKTSTERTALLKAQMSVSCHEKDPRRWRLTLALEIDAEKPEEKKLLPYRMRITGRAYFLFKEDATKEAAEHTLRLNGASILYGLLRAQVFNITALSINEPYLLDTMNFVQAEKQHLKEPPAKEQAQAAEAKTGV
ncbi:MAG: hypothetical protein V1873_04240 [Verrucomicrobiota bacterium]